MSVNWLFFLGVLQLMIIFLATLFYPAVQLQTFVYYPYIKNATLSYYPGNINSFDYTLAFPCLFASFIAMVFVSNTYQMGESGVLSEDQTYSPETLLETGLWDSLFWVFIVVVHFVAIGAMDTPCDVYALLLALVLQVLFLHKICAPSETEHRNFAKSNVNIMGFLLGGGVSLFNIPSHSHSRYAIFFLLFFYDYFLAIGHIWDVQTRVGTVVNCRLCYVCASTLGMAALYGVWNDKLLLS